MNSNAPTTPVREKKSLVVPSAPKKPSKKYRSVDKAIANGYVVVTRGSSYWSDIPNVAELNIAELNIAGRHFTIN